MEKKEALKILSNLMDISKESREITDKIEKDQEWIFNDDVFDLHIDLEKAMTRIIKTWEKLDFQKEKAETKSYKERINDVRDYEISMRA